MVLGRGVVWQLSVDSISEKQVSQCILNCIRMCYKFLNAHCETKTGKNFIDSFTSTLRNNRLDVCILLYLCCHAPPTHPEKQRLRNIITIITSEPTRSITPYPSPALDFKPSRSHSLHTIPFRFHVAPSFCVMRFKVLTLRLLRRPDAKEMMPAEDK